MLDMRKNKKIIMKSITRLAGIQVDEENVKEMFMTLGVEPTDELVREAIGYLSSNSMGMNMDNLYEFLKSKKIMSLKDMRKKK